MSDVGEGARFDFAVLAIGFAEENGGRGLAVGNGGDVHAYIVRHQKAKIQAKYCNITCLHLGSQSRLLPSKQRDFVTNGLELRPRRSEIFGSSWASFSLANACTCRHGAPPA